jgi:hypothetical protein
MTGSRLWIFVFSPNGGWAASFAGRRRLKFSLPFLCFLLFPTEPFRLRGAVMLYRDFSSQAPAG